MLQAGKAALPSDIPRSDAGLVKGPHVLQVMACDDVAHPSRGMSGSSKGRSVLLQLVPPGAPFFSSANRFLGIHTLWR